MTAERYAVVVRHVGIARTVLERFEELARGPSGAAAIGEALSKVGGRDYDRDQAQQLRTGEASQLFPEVWPNLDIAARALEALGEPCAAYVALRGHEPAARPLGLLANGNFNTASARAAREALCALEAATPGIDWAAIARADAALADEAARALGAGSRKLVGIIGGILMAAILVGYIVLRVVAG